MKKIWSWAILALSVMAVILVVWQFILPRFTPSATISTNGTKFKIIDGETSRPLSNRKLTVCDPSAEADPEPTPYCDGRIHPILQKTLTDDNGFFYLEITQITENIKTDKIAVEIDNGYYLLIVGFNPDLSHRFDRDSVRILNQEKSGRVISNRIYDLKTNQVTEIFTDGSPQKTSIYEVIEVKAYKFN